MIQLNYTEKGNGLHEALGAAGLGIICHDGIWLGPADAQAFIDAYDALAWARDQKWQQIKTKREAVKYAGVPIASVGKTIDTDEGARSQQLGLVLMGASIPSGLMWKFADNSFAPMTPTLAAEVLAATAARDMAVFAVAEGFRSQIGAMSDWQAVIALDITAGWPG